MREQSIYNFQAENGLHVWLRPLRATDGEYLVDLFDHMSLDSRYQRFNVPLPNPDIDWVQKRAEQLAYVRPADGWAWLAFADLPEQPHAPVGGVRCIRVSPDVGEVSLAVRDDLHNLGIGTKLLIFAGRQAYAGGLNRLLGVVQSGNRALWHSLRHMNVPMTRSREGTHTIIEVDLQKAEVFHWKPDPDPGKVAG